MLSKGDWVVVVVVGRNGRLGMLMPLPAIPDITLPMLSIPGNSNWADGALLFLCVVAVRKYSKDRMS